MRISWACTVIVCTEVAEIDGQPLQSRRLEAYPSRHFKGCVGTSRSTNAFDSIYLRILRTMIVHIRALYPARLRTAARRGARCGAGQKKLLRVAQWLQWANLALFFLIGMLICSALGGNFHWACARRQLPLGLEGGSAVLRVSSGRQGVIRASNLVAHWARRYAKRACTIRKSYRSTVPKWKRTASERPRGDTRPWRWIPP